MAQLVKVIDGLAIASCKVVDGLAIASVKTVNGLDNTSAGGGWSFTSQATDAFTTDANPIDGNWTSVTGDSNMKKLSGSAVPTNTANDCSARSTSGASFTNDQASELAITTSGTGGGGVGMGVLVRCASAAATYYRAVMDGAASNNIEIGKRVAGVYSFIANRTVSYGAGGTLRLGVVGTTLRVYYNGTQVGADITDSDIASGSPGISYSSTDATAQGDNWVGYSVT